MTSTTDTAFGTDLVAGTWTIDPSHSEVGFTVRHLMSKVRGQFKKFEGTLTTGDDARGDACRTPPSTSTRSTPATPAATATCARPTSSTWRTTAR